MDAELWYPPCPPDAAPPPAALPPSPAAPNTATLTIATDGPVSLTDAQAKVRIGLFTA